MKSNNPFKDIHDICGIRVICLFLSDIERINKIIDNNFKKISFDNKIENLNFDSFGYMSVHHVVKLSDKCKGPRYDNIKDIACEIQIRTIAMHAWATISHYLDYKTTPSIPSHLRKDFYALSGLFYVADSHFELFVKAGQKSKDQAFKITEKPGKIFPEEINLDTLIAYLSKRFPKREKDKSNEISELISELTQSGYFNIGDLDSALTQV